MKYIDNKIVYEVGDWVRCNSENFNSNWQNRVSQIAKADDGKYRLTYCVNAEPPFSASELIPATQQEINKEIQEIKVGDYKVLFCGIITDKQCEYIKVGCEEVSKELFLKLGKIAGWI